MRRFFFVASLVLAVLGSGLGAACSGGDAAVAPAIEAGDESASDAQDDRRKMPPPVTDSAAPPVTGPDKLSETGLYADFASRTLAPGIRTYTPRYELWSDGATKKRYLYLPPNSTIDTTSMDHWIFPVGTKAWKEFTFGGVVVETRLLWKVRADAWWEVAYVWLPDGSDAIAAPNGMPNALDAGHDVPDQVNCDDCHGNVVDVLIGVSALQLSMGGKGMLTDLAASGLLSAPPAGEFEVPGDGGTKDALGYMHGNCAHCHNGLSRINTVAMQTTMRLDVSTLDTTPEQTGAYQTTFHLKMKHLILPNISEAVVPGDPKKSGLVNRMNRRDYAAMPPRCTAIVDDAGVGTVSAWVASLPP